LELLTIIGRFVIVNILLICAHIQLKTTHKKISESTATNTSTRPKTKKFNA